jgi:biopolymer transport protein ExbD
LKTLKGGKGDPNQGLLVRVVIRADRETPFSKLFELIKICQDHHFQKFDLKAMNAP